MVKPSCEQLDEHLSGHDHHLDEHLAEHLDEHFNLLGVNPKAALSFDIVKTQTQLSI